MEDEINKLHDHIRILEEQRELLFRTIRDSKTIMIKFNALPLWKKVIIMMINKEPFDN